MPDRKIAYRRTMGTHFAISGRTDGRQFDRDSKVPHALFRLDVSSMKEQTNRAIATAVLTLFRVAVVARYLGDHRQSWSCDPWTRFALCVALLSR
jgi:hypothetical protein